MKTREIELAPGDRKAAAHILDNLTMDAQAHALSRILLQRFTIEFGAKLAIAPDWLPIEMLEAFRHSWVAPEGSPSCFALGERPIDRLEMHLQRAVDPLWLVKTRLVIGQCSARGRPEVTKCFSLVTRKSITLQPRKCLEM